MSIFGVYAFWLYTVNVAEERPAAFLHLAMIAPSALHNEGERPRGSRSYEKNRPS